MLDIVLTGELKEAPTGAMGSERRVGEEKGVEKGEERGEDNSEADAGPVGDDGAADAAIANDAFVG